MQNAGVAMTPNQSRNDLIHIALPLEEMAALDAFRLKQQVPSRAEAARALIRLGVQSLGNARQNKTDEAAE